MAATRKFVEAVTVKPGKMLVADGGFTCIRPGERLIVGADQHGLYVPCDEGCHYLDGQLEGSRYVGLYSFSREHDRSPHHIRVPA